MRLLSIDWDFFFPELSCDPDQWMLYDWGHRDSGKFFLDYIWYERAIGFKQNDLPLPGTSGDERDFWKKFAFKPHSKLYVSESHVQIYHKDLQPLFTVHRENSIDNYDAHHDAGYRGNRESFITEGQVSCENWAMAYGLSGVSIRTLYPKWKTWAKKIEPTPVHHHVRRVATNQPVLQAYDHVFVCRSGGWTPPWLDDQFEDFLASCPVKHKIELMPVQNRNWDQQRFETQYKTYMDAMKELKIHQQK